MRFTKLKTNIKALIGFSVLFILCGSFFFTCDNSASIERIPSDEKEIVEIKLDFLPDKKTYEMGEPLDLTGLQVRAIYNDHSDEITTYYKIHGETFKKGITTITIAVSNKNITKSASFDITVSGELIDTGLPVIYINTEEAKPIDSREIWVRMSVKVVSDNPEHSFERTFAARDDIRGRGNSTWWYPKRPYRMRFRDEVSMFGLTAARNWVLLANWKVASLMSDTVAFELGQRFDDGPLFKNHFEYVDLVLNDEYQGTYILTEHMRPAPGRVEINTTTDYLVELSFQYDEDPKFRLPNLKSGFTEENGTQLGLPVMITSPDFGTDINDSRYQFVIDSMNQFDSILSDPAFPNNNWKNYIDMDSFVDYIMINEMVFNHELGNPGSVYICKIAGQKIRMSHLWDFDWAYAMWDGRNVTTGDWRPVWKVDLGVFGYFFKDAEFQANYKARWNEKYQDIRSINSFMDETAAKIKISQSLNNRRWYDSNDAFALEMTNFKEWWSQRAEHLNWAINRDAHRRD
jgi:hypothetical protein